jgi:cytosine/adenosine deaminase-related metal-dependent hydrolase
LIVRGARVLDPLAPEPRPAVRDIAIAGDRIAAVETPGNIQAPAGARVVEAKDMLAIPGLVSAHYHSHDTLLKGCFAPMPLETWLLHAVPPNYPQRSREEIRARVLIGALEALKSGITTLQDMATVHPFDPAEVDTILQAYEDAGVRCVFALQVGDVPGSRPLPFWDELIPPGLRGDATVSVRRGGNARELIARVEGERKRHAGRHSRITWGLGPATPEICSEEYLGLLAELSEREQLPVFCHVYESKGNAAIARKYYGKDGGSLVRHLARVGLLNESAFEPEDAKRCRTGARLPGRRGESGPRHRQLELLGCAEPVPGDEAVRAAVRR